MRTPLTLEETSRGVKPVPFMKQEWLDMWKATSEYEDELLAHAMWRAEKYL